MTFRASPPAKLNLTLEVGPPRADGYHPLRSVFVRLGLSDSLTVRPGEGPRDRLVVGGPLGAPVDSNIVLRAAALLRQRAGPDLPPLDIELDKHIPQAAGLGGGSSDGASMLELAAACWGVGLSPAVRLELAAELGSDVPFFATGAQAALVEGRGERVTPLPAVAGQAGVLLVTPPLEVSTPAAFGRHDALGGDSTGAGVSDSLAAAFSAGIDGAGLEGWLERLRDANDLWPAAVSLAPALGEVRQQLESATNRPWLLSGSGSSLFTFYPVVQQAAEAGARLAAGAAAAIASSLIYATDLVGPDPAWRKQ